MSQTLRANALPDLLALVPYRMGFEPTASIVALEFAAADEASPEHRKVGIIARADLPPGGSEEVVERASRDCIRALTDWMPRHDVRALMLVVYDNGASDGASAPGDPVTAASSPALSHPAAVTVRTARTHLARLGIDVLDVVLVGADSFRSLDCADERCCPLSGRSLAAVRASAMHAEAVGLGMSARTTREQLAPDESPLPAPARAARP
ncbi:hypothetical protein GCM10027586_06040 [Kineococcus gypseus]|uniref:DUF4192 family protein n=1 Tax=Kineococcus gypseus TaxID=1637102 RepID=UPI003D7D9FBE